MHSIGENKRFPMKNRGKGQNPTTLIRFVIIARKRVTSRMSVSSYKIRRRNSGTNKERNLGNLVMLVLWNHISLMENFWLHLMMIRELVRIRF